MWKAVPGWIVLNRRHATELVALNSFREPLGDLVRAWGPPGPWTERKGGVFAPEEVFFPTMLALLGYLDSNKLKLIESAAANNQPLKYPREVLIRSAMYAEFERNGDANPRSFDRLAESFVSQCRREGYLFARKFPDRSVSVEEWSQRVLGEDSVPACLAVNSSRVNSSSASNGGSSGNDRYRDEVYGERSRSDASYRSNDRYSRESDRDRDSISDSRDRQRYGEQDYRHDSGSYRGGGHGRDRSRERDHNADGRYGNREHGRAAGDYQGRNSNDRREDARSSGSFYDKQVQQRGGVYR